MGRILLAYATGEGQTKKVTTILAATFDARGYDVDTIDVTRPPTAFDVADYGAVLVGASIHVGAQQPAVVSFVSEHLDALATRPTGFYQVSLSAAMGEDGKAQAAGYIEDFLAKTGWQPDRIASFGGALRYSEYGFLKRAIIKRIAKQTTGDTDTSRDYEYTDWDEVRAFAMEFAADLDAERTDDLEAGPSPAVDSGREGR